METEMTAEARDHEDHPDAIRERIASAIHERYRRNQRGRKPETDASMKPWDQLSESLKRSNREQAADIERKLRTIACRIVPANGQPVAFTFTAEELERLAILEHERWVAERRAAGWTPGPVKDVGRKLTPYLVPWEDLADEIREYDRDAVRAIPDILAAAGFEIQRVRG
jgi:hypothetical protein